MSTCSVRKLLATINARIVARGSPSQAAIAALWRSERAARPPIKAGAILIRAPRSQGRKECHRSKLGWHVETSFRQAITRRSQTVVPIQTPRPRRATPQSSGPLFLGCDSDEFSGAGMNCPVCSSSMVLRTARKGRNAGNQFWGCSRYPACRGTRPAGAGVARTRRYLSFSPQFRRQMRRGFSNFQVFKVNCPYLYVHRT